MDLGQHDGASMGWDEKGAYMCGSVTSDVPSNGWYHLPVAPTLLVNDIDLRAKGCQTLG